METLLAALGISLGINVAMFLAAFRLQSDKLTDVSYAITFSTLAIWGLSRSSGSRYAWLLTAIALVWAVRIGSFLLFRVIRTGKDSRFDGMREHFIKFGRFWLGQGLTVWVLMIPFLLAMNHEHAITPLAAIGTLIWLAGFLIEATADFQKYNFTHNPANENKWIDQGVWKYSRHPNYFGEILVWVGVYVCAFSALPGVDKLIGLVSPLFITILLLFVSGIPILEKSADKRWDDNPKYRAYKHRTSILIPLPRK